MTVATVKPTRLVKKPCRRARLDLPRPRHRLPYEPAFEGVVEGYVLGMLRRDFWRVQASMERDDVLQEARIVFLRCSRAYPGVEAPHFMALFKTAWARRFADLSNSDTAHRSLLCYESSAPLLTGGDEDEDPGITATVVGCTDNDGHLRVLLRQAPREVRMVLALLLDAPAELLELVQSSMNAGSRRICHLLGLPDDIDVLGMTRDYLEGGAGANAV